jgi:hypothetical protein
MYLEESTEWVARAGAQHNVRHLAQRIDKAAEELHFRYVILCYHT